METLTRLVSESLARHGFDRPLDYRRLQWSRWFRCESHHSLLCVPSKPGIFALAEEIMDLRPGKAEVEDRHSSNVEDVRPGNVEERRFSAASGTQGIAALAAASSQAGNPKPEADSGRRMLAVTQFFEDDDMAFVLDRMLSRNHPMRGRLESGRYFVRFVEIQDQAQRRSICSALNQWIVSSSEKATGIGSHFASSLEVAPATEQGNVGRTLMSATADTMTLPKSGGEVSTAKTKANPLEAVTASTVQRIPLFPSGF
ncbi:MAG: hypothetical protein WA485_22590 [Candidatus Sulfotelmatobacter sp.]